MRRRPLIQAVPAAALGALPAAASHANTPSAVDAPGLKIFRTALRSPETTLDPAQTNSDQNTNLLLANIFEAPLCYDYLARPAKLLPNTAAAMPEVSADFKTFTVRIKPGIFFSDDPAFKGQRRELVAQDYVFAIKRFFDPRWNSSDLYVYETLKIAGLAELRERALKTRQPFDYDTPTPGLLAPERYTLRITLGVADPRFIWRLADPVLMGAVAREVVQAYGGDVGAHPVGTGAFRLKSWRRGSRIELERSPSYRGTTYEGTPANEPAAQEIARFLKGKTLPLVDRVVADVIEEEQPRWLSFLDGSYDWLEVPGPFNQLAAPKGQIAPYLAKQGVKAQLALQPDMAMHFFFMEHPLVGGYTPGKVALRRAIGLACDNESYLRVIGGGFGILAQSTISPHTSGYDAAYRSEMSEFNPAKARALLDLYGYVDRNGDGWREQPDGSPLVLQISGTASQRERRINELWKRSLDAVGLKVEFEISTWPELLKKSRAGTLMIWRYSWSAGSPDGGFFLEIAYGPNAGEANDPRFALPAFDRLYEAQRVLPDGPEREALMRQAKNLLVAYMPYKVHMHRALLDLVHPWLQGYWRHPFMRDWFRYMAVEGRGPGR
jgi:ABC-type transport system substrate-binding protein